MVLEAADVEDEGTATVTVAGLAFVYRARIVARLAVDIVLGLILFDLDAAVHQGIVHFEVFLVAHVRIIT
jgi:hypothetical protein